MMRPRAVAGISAALAAAVTVAALALPPSAATSVLIGPMIIGIFLGAAPVGGLHDNLPAVPFMVTSGLINAAIWGATCGGIWNLVIAAHQARSRSENFSKHQPNER